VSAKLIFSSAIKYLCDHFMKTLDTSGIGIQEDGLYWVITVPAIWTDSCKQFMREAAIQVSN